MSEELIREKSPKGDTSLIKICVLGSTERMKKILVSFYDLHGFVTDSYSLHVEGVMSSLILRSYQIEGKKYRVYILPNLEKRFRKVVEQPTSHFYLGAKGIIIFFDLDDRDSFEDVNKWHWKLSQENLASIPKSLIGLRGNKDSVVSTEEITNIATDINAKYYQIVRPRILSNRAWALRAWEKRGIALKFEEILKDFLKQLILSRGVQFSL